MYILYIYILETYIFLCFGYDLQINTLMRFRQLVGCAKGNPKGNVAQWSESRKFVIFPRCLGLISFPVPQYGIYEFARIIGAIHGDVFLLTQRYL